MFARFDLAVAPNPPSIRPSISLGKENYSCHLNRISARPSPYEKRIQIKTAQIVSGCWQYNSADLPLTKLGEGKDHRVYALELDATLTVETTKGAVQFHTKEVVLKPLLPTKMTSPTKLARALHEDREARKMVEANFARIGLKAPLARLLIDSQEMIDAVNPKNGVEIWERCFPLDAQDPALWTWASELLLQSVQFGLKHGRELVGSFRPPNAMKNAAGDFVIVDMSTGSEAESKWQQRVARYAGQWCKFCGKSLAELTADWPADAVAAIQLKYPQISLELTQDQSAATALVRGLRV